MAGVFAAMYETRHGHAPRMRRSCWSIDAPRWTVCSLLWRLHVVHEFVFLKASVGTLREHCARLEGCFGACERFQKSRLNVLPIQELMARAHGKLGPLPR